MATLGFWGWVVLILRLLPDLISLVKRSIVWVDGKVDVASTRAKLAALAAATDKAQQTGDTSDVEAIFNPRP